MNRPSIAIYSIAAGLLSGLLACSPRYNWRELRMEQTPLLLMLPCKPEQASRSLAFGNSTLDMHMLGCEAGDSTFAITATRVQDPSLRTTTLALWQRSTQARWHIATAKPLPFTLNGSTSVDGTGQINATGQAADGKPMAIHAAWFAQGPWLFQAAVYTRGGPRNLSADVTDTFFSGLRLP
jgi:hypothetical protein